MLKEALEFLSQQARDGKKVQILKPEAEPKHVYAIVQEDGSAEWRDAQPQPRAHVAASIQPVIDFASKADDAAVWYSRAGVVALIDNDTRRDRVTLPLSLSPQMVKLLELERASHSFPQPAFVKLLRTTFADCLSTAGNLLDIIRTVKFINNDGGTAVVQQGKTSIGRQIQQEVTGAGALPDYVTLTVPTFAGAFLFRGPVRCALEVNTGDQTFQLLPLPGELEANQAGAEAAIGEVLRAGLGDVPAYYGRPE
jgi:hypothetical protein